MLRRNHVQGHEGPRPLQKMSHRPAESQSASDASSLTVALILVWIGYSQSLQPCQSGTLNMDITATAFLEGQPMLQLIGSTVGMQNVSGGLNPGQVRSINTAIRGTQAVQKGQGKNQQKGAAVAGKHKSQPGIAKQAVLKDTSNAPQRTQAKGINKAGVQLETKTDAADNKGALQLLQDSQGFALAAEVGGVSRVIGWIVSV
ncbi:TPA: Protein argonaute-3 [Trebouxia sp. C0005]